jgi:hypothetical protein
MSKAVSSKDKLLIIGDMRSPNFICSLFERDVDKRLLVYYMDNY